jgi:hypothetical protein
MAFDPAAWLQQMRSNTGTKVPMGPTEALGSKAGSRKPKRGASGRKVPDVSKAFTRKL